MIYLLITFAGLLLVIAGLYAMSLGFSTPPNFLFFVIGLFCFVLGIMLVILFASRIDLASFKRTESKTRAAPVNERAKLRESTVAVKTAMKPKEIKPKAKKVKKPAKRISPKKIEEKRDKVVPEVKKETAEPKQIKPAKSPRKFLRMPKFGKKDKSEEITPAEKISEPANAKTTPKSADQDKIKAEEPSKKISPQRVPRKFSAKSEDTGLTSKTGPGTSLDDGVSDVSNSSKVEEEAPMEPMKPIKPVKKIDKSDTHYVKERLNKLKQDYIENVDDVEDLIEERLDSFRGAINKIRAESMEPSIIWSFDASDVQEAMKETILKADNKVIMMYPWIRNIDVSVLKKFMDTNSRLIIQEASLDDDASVELMKVLQDNSVQIKTMPHIHTVAVVSDENHGLIISTDPIYESFEVGVIYKDEKSINEIEKLFEEAWKLSNDVTLEETG